MIQRNFYDLVCKEVSDFTPVVGELIRREVMESIGLSVRAMFPGFSKAFPEAVTAMESFYSIPFLLFKETSVGCAYFLASESEGYNFFLILSVFRQRLMAIFLMRVAPCCLLDGWSYIGISIHLLLLRVK